MTSDSSIQLYPVTKAHPAPHLATTLVSWTTATATHQLVNKLWQVEGELHHSNSGCGSSAIAAPWYQRKHSSEAYFHLWKSGSLLGDRSNWLTNAACLARTIWMSQRTVCFQFNLQKSMTPSIAVSITLWSVGDAECVKCQKTFFSPTTVGPKTKNSQCQCLWKGSAYPCLQLYDDAEGDTYRTTQKLKKLFW